MARIEDWSRLDVGVGATIRGLRACDLRSIEVEARPFLLATVEDTDSDEDTESALEMSMQVADTHAQVEALAKRHDIKRNANIRVDPRALLFMPDVLADDNLEEELGLAQRAKDLAADLGEPYLDVLSFLALEGAEPMLKLTALQLPTEDRLFLANTRLERLRDELAAKAAIKQLDLSWDKTD